MTFLLKKNTFNFNTLTQAGKEEEIPSVGNLFLEYLLLPGKSQDVMRPEIPPGRSPNFHIATAITGLYNSTVSPSQERKIKPDKS